MWHPPAYAYPDEWADAERVMPPASPYPGRWSTDRTPYLRAPMRAFADPQYDVVVLIMRRQRGKTELAMNCLGWAWKTLPAPSVWLMPTEKLARSFAADRVDAMFSSVPGLSERTTGGGLERFVAGTRFGIGWAGSRTEVASHPAKYAIIDERSRMAGDAGGEGDPVRIVMAGGAMYPGATALVVSSPTEEGLCPTHAWWSQGTRNRWAWRCPGCGWWFAPQWKHVVYPDKASYSVIREEAHIACPRCIHEIRDPDVPELEADYVPSVPVDEGEDRLEPELETRNSVASFWVTGLSDQITHIGRAAERYVRAAREGEPGAVQAVVNTELGELWVVPSAGVAADAVRDRQVDAIPADEIQIVTMGVDVQEHCLYYVVRGWCFAATSYLLDHGQLHGVTEQAQVWADLRGLADQPFCGHVPRMVLIDSGYQAEMVYEQCRKAPTFHPAKGVARGDRPYWDTKVDESFSGRALKALKLWSVATDTWKQWLYGRIRWEAGTPGAWYVPAGIDDTYCRSVTNEVARIRRGRREWERTGDRHNHYLDCEVLAAVAAHICNVRQLGPAGRAPAPKPEPPSQGERWLAEHRRRQMEGRGDPFSRRRL